MHVSIYILTYWYENTITRSNRYLRYFQLNYYINKAYLSLEYDYN